LVILTLLLALTCLAAMTRIAATIGMTVPLDPNEGWNAYHTVAAMSGRPLYPGATSPLFNNYPPLSFYIVGVLANFIGDAIVAGRILSLVATLCVAAGIAVALRRMKAGRFEALFAALLFIGGLLVFTDYVGMDDPQLLGHAIAIIGFILLIREPRNPRDAVVAALLMTLAGFVKHNLIAQPIAAILWLAVYDRRNAVRFAISGIGFSLIGLAAFRLIYGIGLLAQLQSPRLYSFAALWAGIGNWLIWGGIPIVATIVLFMRRRGDRYVVLCAIYALVSVVLGSAFIGGAGVDMNAWFDAAIALALAAGLAMDRLAPKPWIAALAAAAYTFPLLLGLVFVADRDWMTTDYWLHPYAEEAATAYSDIALLKSRDGPALCEMMSLCYWAAKPAQVDVFNLGQAFATHRRSDDELVRLVDARYFHVAQFDSLTDFALSPRVLRAFQRSYRAERSDDNGVFLVPR
jgi:hypothetical protein